MRFARFAAAGAAGALILAGVGSAWATPITVSPGSRALPPGAVNALVGTGRAELTADAADHDIILAQPVSSTTVDIRRIGRTGATVGSLQVTPDPTASAVQVTQVAPVPGSVSAWVAIMVTRANHAGVDAWLARFGGGSGPKLIRVPITNLTGDNFGGMVPTGVAVGQYLYVLGAAAGVINGTSVGQQGAATILVAFNRDTGDLAWVHSYGDPAADTTFSKLTTVGPYLAFTHGPNSTKLGFATAATSSASDPLQLTVARQSTGDAVFQQGIGPNDHTERGIAADANMNIAVAHSGKIETFAPTTPTASAWALRWSCDTGVPFLILNSLALGPEGVIVPADGNTVRGLDGGCVQRWSGTAGTPATGNFNDVAYDAATGEVFFAGAGFVTRFQPYSAPSAPSMPTATPGDGHALISWQPPSSNGKLPITGYRVDLDFRIIDVGPNTTSVDVTGLTNGRGYSVRVTASNAVGRSQPAFVSFTPVAPPLTISIEDATAPEGVRNQVAMLRLNRAAPGAVAVRYASVEGTAGRRDFTRHQGLVVFSPGQTTATVPVSARRDRTAEGAEFYSLQLSSPTGAQLARTSAKVNIPANNT